MRRLLKWAAVGLAGILGLVLLIAGVLYFIGSAKVDRTYQVRTASLTLPDDSLALRRGAHLTRIHGCVDCHGPDLSGQVFADAPPFRITASNLTSGRGGVGATYSVEDFDRAIRHGVKPDGRPVFIMPSAAFHRLSDEDTGALIAYLKRVPPVDNELPPTEIRAPGRMMAAGLIDPAMEVRTEPFRTASAPPAGSTAEYGAYLASITCAYCHGENLRGAQPPNPDSPPAPDLSFAGQWSVDQFKQTLRTGLRPSGDSLDVRYMPWSMTAAMEDHELEALHAHLATLNAGASTASQ